MLLEESLQMSAEDCGLLLHQAVLSNDRKRIKKLIRIGIPVNFPNSKNQSPLYSACYEGLYDIVSFLLKNGSNPNMRSRDGSTPVHAAGFSCNTKILSVLVEFGAELRLHDNQGRSLKDWVQFQPDTKKRRGMLEFIERGRAYAIKQIESGMTLTTQNNLSTRSQLSQSPWSKSDISFVGNLFKHKQLDNLHVLPSDHILHSGFGKFYVDGSTFRGLASHISVAPEMHLKHDPYGTTYNNGAFMVMESMMWIECPVTVKRLHQTPPDGGSVDLLLTEIKHAARLRHPSLLNLLAVCHTQRLANIVLLYERVSLGSLYSHLYIKVETLTVPQICEIMKSVCDGLLFLHQNLLVHSYISSHAIQLITPNLAKLSNLEYLTPSRFLSSGDHTQQASEVLKNVYMNSCYNWMAPEVMAGSAPSAKSDLYSLCAVIWESLNGKPPWSGQDAAEIRQLVLEEHQKVSVPESVCSPFNALLAVGLEPTEKHRNLSVQQLRDVLTRVPLVGETKQLITSPQPHQMFRKSPVVSSALKNLSSKINASESKKSPKRTSGVKVTRIADSSSLSNSVVSEATSKASEKRNTRHHKSPSKTSKKSVTIAPESTSTPLNNETIHDDFTKCRKGRKSRHSQEGDSQTRGRKASSSDITTSSQSSTGRSDKHKKDTSYFKQDSHRICNLSSISGIESLDQSSSSRNGKTNSQSFDANDESKDASNTHRSQTETGLSSTGHNPECVSSLSEIPEVKNSSEVFISKDDQKASSSYDFISNASKRAFFSETAPGKKPMSKTDVHGAALGSDHNTTCWSDTSKSAVYADQTITLDSSSVTQSFDEVDSRENPFKSVDKDSQRLKESVVVKPPLAFQPASSVTLKKLDRSPLFSSNSFSSTISGSISTGPDFLRRHSAQGFGQNNINVPFRYKAPESANSDSSRSSNGLNHQRFSTVLKTFRSPDKKDRTTNGMKPTFQEIPAKSAAQTRKPMITSSLTYNILPRNTRRGLEDSAIHSDTNTVSYNTSTIEETLQEEEHQQSHTAPHSVATFDTINNSTNDASNTNSVTDIISPRDQMDSWHFGGAGSCKNLISGFQKQLNQHQEKQSMLNSRVELHSSSDSAESVKSVDKYRYNNNKTKTHSMSLDDLLVDVHTFFNKNGLKNEPPKQSQSQTNQIRPPKNSKFVKFSPDKEFQEQIQDAKTSIEVDKLISRTFKKVVEEYSSPEKNQACHPKTKNFTNLEDLKKKYCFVNKNVDVSMPAQSPTISEFSTFPPPDKQIYFEDYHINLQPNPDLEKKLTPVKTRDVCVGVPSNSSLFSENTFQRESQSCNSSARSSTKTPDSIPKINWDSRVSVSEMLKLVTISSEESNTSSIYTGAGYDSTHNDSYSSSQGARVSPTTRAQPDSVNSGNSSYSEQTSPASLSFTSSTPITVFPKTNLLRKPESENLTKNPTKIAELSPEKVVRIRARKGYTEQVKVDSNREAGGMHTITRSTTNLETGDTSSTSKTVQASKVITEIVHDDQLVFL